MTCCGPCRSPRAPLADICTLLLLLLLLLRGTDLLPFGKLLSQLSPVVQGDRTRSTHPGCFSRLFSWA